MAAEARARETQPLIPRGDRLGGSRTGQSRLVVPEIQPAPEEPARWVIPEEATTMERIMRGAKRTTNDIIDNVKQQAAVIGDTVGGVVDNVRHRLTGRSRKGGTYTRLEQQDKFQRNLNKGFIQILMI